jgi:predicted HTH domain antitoxin
MLVEIPEEVFAGVPKYTLSELKIDFAVFLYQQGRTSLARAAQWCGLSRLEFQAALAKRDITLRFSESDLEHDVSVLEKLFEK